MLKLWIRDYMLKDKVLLAESEIVKDEYKIKVKNYDSRHIKVKLIDEFNYVVHINFVLDENNFLIDYCCDHREQCKEQFCSHCLIAYKYITEQCNRNIFLRILLRLTLIKLI